jgi:hypothetical protein
MDMDYLSSIEYTFDLFTISPRNVNAFLAARESNLAGTTANR